MKTLLGYIDQITEEEADSDSTHYAGLDIDNTEVLYQKAMRAKNPGELKKSMLAMQDKFPDAKKIQFKKVDWAGVYKDLNESLVLEGKAEEAINDLNKLIDKAIASKDKKTLDSITKELDKILKNL